MTSKLLCPNVSVSTVKLYSTMSEAKEGIKLPPHICKAFKQRLKKCEGCEEIKEELWKIK